MANARDEIFRFINRQVHLGRPLLADDYDGLHLDHLLDVVEKDAVHAACEKIRAMNGECMRCEGCTTRSLVADELDPYEKVGNGELADKKTGMPVIL